ncbi:MAG: UTP--glucose-1-phosphate uridylyltransferase [Alphaproteobacteria bacterium]
MSRCVRTAVLPVAGLGTRFLPATKVMPKEMLPVVDKPVIQYAIEEARAAGIERFVFVNGRGKGMLEDHFDLAYELNATLEARGKKDLLAVANEATLPPGALASVRQQEPLGLGHAVWCARDLVGDEPFAVMLPDELTVSQPSCMAGLIAAHEETGGNVVSVMEVPLEQTSRYGILDTGGSAGPLFEARAMIEKPTPEEAPSRLAIIGRYVLLPEVFDHLARQETGAGGEIQLTDGMARMIGRHPFHGLRFDGRRFDCGDKAGWLEANLALALERPDLGAAIRGFLPRYAG